MSEALPDFKLLQPATLEEAVALMEQDESARLCAGGSDLLVNMRRGLVEAETLIDLSAIAGFDRIRADRDELFIGAGVTLNALAENETVAKSCPAIVEAALAVAGPSHREVATVGGNLCLDTRCLYYNQSHWWRKSNDFCLKYKGEICHVAPTKKQCRAAFSGDLAPALMVHGADVEITGPKGKRRIPLAELYREDGADHLCLEKPEIVSGVVLSQVRLVSGYRKIRLRGAIDFPLAGVAISCEKSATSNAPFVVAVTGTNSCPIMVEVPGTPDGKEDADLFFKALAKAVQKGVTPLRTTTTAANYRRLSVSAMAERLARELWAR